MSLGKFMKSDSGIVSKTVYFSLFMQILTTLLSIRGIEIKLDDKDKILTEILVLETVVQVIEAIFYVWVIFGLSNLKVMSARRYYDWYLTTPIMLFTTIAFMEYKKNKTNTINLKNFLVEHKTNIILIFIANFLMLTFGLMNETNMLSKIVAIPIGTLFFLFSFYIIYDKYAKSTLIGNQLFYFLFIVWALYGVAACFNNKYKNTMYNCLDIVSKNFYGLFIYYYILSIKKNE